jgi:hypothetical protein
MTAEPRRVPPEQRYRDALKWIRIIAGLHYFGGAFNPEHMRDIANLAANALDLGPHSREIPDFEERMADGRQRASEMAAALGIELAGDEEEDDGGHRT